MLKCATFCGIKLPITRCPRTLIVTITVGSSNNIENLGEKTHKVTSHLKSLSSNIHFPLVIENVMTWK